MKQLDCLLTNAKQDVWGSAGGRVGKEVLVPLDRDVVRREWPRGAHDPAWAVDAATRLGTGWPARNYVTLQ